MGSSNLGLWKDIAAAYRDRLSTSTADVHFGVGIPGNAVLGIVRLGKGRSAVDLGCGSGENLVALARLGYVVTGVDGLEDQLRAAQCLLAQCGGRASLVVGDICDLGFLRDKSFDVVLCIGALHFCRELDSFFEACARIIRPGGKVIVSVPHPMDMVVDVVEGPAEKLIVVHGYFPENNVLRNAHYWRKFAGRLAIGIGLTEYLHKPSALVCSMVDHGFCIDGLWEPPATPHETVPCQFQDPDPWFAEVFVQRVPQYLIVRATYTPELRAERAR